MKKIGHLHTVMDEIFGEENFEGHIHWRRRHNQPNDRTKMIAIVAEHMLCYAKDSVAYKRSGVGKVGLTGAFSNPDNDPHGDWASKPWKVGSDQSGSRYTITTPTGKIYTMQNGWETSPHINYCFKITGLFSRTRVMGHLVRNTINASVKMRDNVRPIGGTTINLVIIKEEIKPLPICLHRKTYSVIQNQLNY